MKRSQPLWLMGEALLRSHVHALRSQLPALQRLDLEDNVVELRIQVEGRSHRLNFLIYEAGH